MESLIRKYIQALESSDRKIVFEIPNDGLDNMSEQEVFPEKDWCYRLKPIKINGRTVKCKIEVQKDELRIHPSNAPAKNRFSRTVLLEIATGNRIAEYKYSAIDTSWEYLTGSIYDINRKGIEEYIAGYGVRKWKICFFQGS